MKSRNLIQKILIGVTSLLLMNISFNSCSKDEETGDKEEILTIDLTLPAYNALKSVGGFVILSEKQMILVRYSSSNSGYGAWDSKCTFCAGTLTFDQVALTKVKCNSCNSVFGPDGEVLNGPATQPVKAYYTKVEGNNLLIYLN